MELTRVYSLGKKARKSHYLDPGDSPNSWCPAICNSRVHPPLGELWHGTGTQAEEEEAASRELCTGCMVIARDLGYTDEDDGSDLTLDTALGDVDTVAVDRVLAGVACELNQAERNFLLRKLAEKIGFRPVGGSQDSDPSVVHAASALGLTVHAMNDLIYRTNRRLAERRVRHA